MTNKSSEIIIHRPVMNRHGVGERYSWDKKQEVCEKMLALNNVRLVAELTNVTTQTIQNWKKTEWWQDLVNEIKSTEKVQLDNKLKQLINKSLDVVEDRLENGEIVMNNKTGELVRKPVVLRDTARVASDLISKRLAIEKDSQEIQLKKDSMKETLVMLATEFARWNTQQNKRKPTEDIEDAVYAEWETGLQEGSETLHIETRSGEETSRTE